MEETATPATCEKMQVRDRAPACIYCKMSMHEAETDLSELLQGRLGANLRARDLDGPGGDGYAEGGLHLRY